MVHFVGAGPGDPELLTLKGRRLLEEADVVIYAGSLVNPALLSCCKMEARIFDSARMSLPEVLSELERAEAEGLVSVRLHTGDPSLYGAIREQTDALLARGIPFDITPGVSSFSAAAAALQTEYTLPGITQSVVITRAAGRTEVPPRESLRSFAAHGATMVLFLSTGLLGKVREELTAGGFPDTTPAAVVYRASWPSERVLRTDLAHLEETAKSAGISNTALIVVGEVLGTPDYQLSKLYDETFSTAFRKGISKDT